jgi:F-type H+-transporting ATPase subunit b
MKTAKPAALALGIVALASVAFAAAPGHDPHHAPPISTLLFPLVNFSIFVFILWRYAWPAVRSTLAERRRKIEHEIVAAESAHREARLARDEIEALRARSQQDAAALVASVRAEAEAQAAALVEATRRAAERIRRDALLLATQEQARAAQAIRADVAALVVARAEVIVRERFGTDDQKRAVAAFLSDIASGAGG